MDVCVLTDGYPPWEHGGAQKIARQLATAYADRGHDVSVITTVEDEADVGRTRADGVTVDRLHLPRRPRLLPYLRVYNPSVLDDVGRLYDAIEPDVVHAHNVHYLSTASLRLAERRSIPVVKTFHDAGDVVCGELTAFLDEVPVGSDRRVPAEAYEVSQRRQLRKAGASYNPLRDPITRRHLASAVDASVAVSHELARALAVNGVPCDAVVHNGISPDEMRPATDEGVLRERLGLGDDRIVLFGGRTGYNKGGAHLAAAFRELVANTDADVTLLVTGDSDYVSRMRDVAGPAADGIRTTGWLDREELRGAFRAATVAATPSRFLDPFPTVNLEAFAAGTPVVTTRFGGASELVDDGVDGAVVDPRDVDGLAATLREYVERPNVAAAAGDAGREKVQAEFSVEGQVDAYLDVLRTVADAEPRRPAPIARRQ